MERKEEKGLLYRIRSWYRPCEIQARVRKQNRVSVLYLKYWQYRGKVSFKKLYPYTIGCPKTILCDPSLDLSQSPFLRFSDREFQRLMMEKFVLSLAHRAGDSFGAGQAAFYDPMGEYPLMAQRLLAELSTLTVITEMPRFYEIESERMRGEIGASLMVSNSPERLSDCRILISPRQIGSSLPLSSETIVFTSEKPSVPLRGIVITDYHPVFPGQYRRFLPEGIDEAEFLSALYSLCGVKELEKLVPVRCGSERTIFTPEQLLHRFAAFQRTA